jgi:predicted PurR-regulated permease PerM
MHAADESDDTAVHNVYEPDHSPARDQQEERSSWYRLGQRIRNITPSELMRLLLVLLALSFIIWLVGISWSALLPFQLGILIAYLLIPLVNRLAHYLPRGVAILLIYGMAVLILTVAVAFIVPPLIGQVVSLVRALPSADEVQTWAENLLASYEQFVNTLPREIQTSIQEGTSEAFNVVRNNLLNYVQGAASFAIGSVLSLVNTFTFILGFFMLPFWLFFVLSDEQDGKAAFRRLLPAWMSEDFWALVTIIDRSFRSYIQGQLLLGLIIGMACYLGLTILEMAGVGGIQYKLFLGVFAGTMELIPYIGPFIGAVPAVVVGLMHSWQSALAIALLYLLIQQLEGNLLIPRIVGDSVGIHPAILMMLMIAFSQFGLVWIFVAPPLAAITRDVFWYVYGRVSDPPLPAGVLPQRIRKEQKEPEPAQREQEHVDSTPAPAPLPEQSQDAEPLVPESSER